MEVLDDIESEAKEIMAAGNGWLVYTPLLHKIREAGASPGTQTQLTKAWVFCASWRANFEFRGDVRDLLEALRPAR